MTDDKSIAPSADHFANLVPQWSDFGPPLRPSPDDTAAVQRVVAGLKPAARAVVLGLTPEIIGCAWPEDVELLAVDHSPGMMQKLWPPARGPVNSRALLADWSAMPVESGTVDFVAGDGCYICLAYPEEFAKLSREVCRVLRRSGRLVMRVFLRPDEPETVAHIGAAVGLGQVGSVHALKLRLHAALHGASGRGTRLDDVWRAWKTMPPLPAALAGKRGWTKAEIVGIESYRGLEARYYLPTLPEFRAALPPELTEEACVWGRYELAERCPTMVLIRD